MDDSWRIDALDNGSMTSPCKWNDNWMTARDRHAIAANKKGVAMATPLT
ncbi:MAG TPA: hypothetical protein VKM00_03210 [Luteimonas sp.]|nr:hypothetical protein [Luteimonas sp.]